MAHTPGPWYDHMFLSVACENDGEYGDATCITTTPEDEYASTGVSGDWVAFVPHDRNHAANAALIAAAPELLVVLRRVVDMANCAMEYEGVDDGHTLKRALERISKAKRECERAIAKAEGRE